MVIYGLTNIVELEKQFKLKYQYSDYTLIRENIINRKECFFAIRKKLNYYDVVIVK